MDPVRIGIVGLGRAGMHGHVRELADHADRFRIVSVFDPIPERCEEASRQTGAAVALSLDDLIANPEVELVDVANRSVDHFQTARKALEAGRLVLVEKPLCVRLAEAQALADLDAKLGGGRLFVRHNRRFDPDFRLVQRIIAEGLLGRVYEIKLRRHSFQRRNDWQTVREFGGGQLLNWGTHIVDHALRLLDGPVTNSWSDLQRVAAAGDAEDHLHVILKSANRTVDLEISGGAALPESEYLVMGTRGSLRGSGGEFDLRYLASDQATTLREVDLSPPSGYGSGEELQWVESHRSIAEVEPESMWPSLYAEIRGTGTYEVRLKEVLEVMQVIENARAGTEFAL